MQGVFQIDIENYEWHKVRDVYGFYPKPNLRHSRPSVAVLEHICPECWWVSNPEDFFYSYRCSNCGVYTECSL